MGFFEDWLIPLLENYGLLIVFVTMVAESACILIPSEIVIPYGGFLAAQRHTELWAVILVATVANLVGSVIAYAVGRYGGRAFFLKYGRYVGVRVHHLEKAERWFDRRGEVTVLFTRVMPGVRTFISLPAGIFKMSMLKFLVYSLIGIVPWVAGLAALGYAAGRAAGDNPWDRLQGQFHRFNVVFYVVLAIFVVAVVAWGLRRWRRRRALTNGPAEGPPDPPTSAES
ncbi:MAG: DedA family protein [Actinobacteria bacterium]|jgi:membrane protein DedA with SNARE-associated domain|nr:DedA family protein [Actinomycetota bacterium]